VKQFRSRETHTSSDNRGGCFICNASDAMWTGANAMAVAARHHDATGHETWAEQHLSIRYGRAARAKSRETE